MSAQPPSGWYPDPEDQTRQRYWNGDQWTDHTAPVGQSAAATPPSSPPGDDPAATSTTSATGGEGSDWSTGDGTSEWSSGTTTTRSTSSPSSAGSLNTWNWQAWVVTLLCGGTFISMIGIYNAGKAEGALAAGDRSRAEGFARSARNWTLGGLAFGILSIIAVVALVSTLIAGAGSTFADDCATVTDQDSFQYAFCQGYCESAPEGDPICAGFDA